VYPQYNTMDVIGLQWFLFSVLNVLFFLYSYFTLGLKFNFRPPLKIFILLLCFMFISITYSSNMTLAIQDFSRWLQVFCMAWLFSIHFSNSKISTIVIAKFFFFYLFIEINWILLPLYYELYLNGFEIINAVSIDPSVFNGLTGNKNIAAASVAVKVPCALYLLNSKKYLWKFLGSIAVILSIISIAFISARASFISLGLIMFFTLFHGFFYKQRRISFYSFFIISVFTGFLLSYLFLPKVDGSLITKKIASISFTDNGSSGRTILWENAIDYGLKHPLTGGGLGSWKIESAPYWNTHGSNYLVPYHAHNDFLELFAELGFIGFFLYLILFIVLAFKFIENSILSKSSNSSFYFFCTLSLGAFFVDSVFNFPMERTIMMIPFAVLIILAETSLLIRDEK